jgi:predicted RNA binding protein YcfA (HicA-like mRNA interferase family)
MLCMVFSLSEIKIIAGGMSQLYRKKCLFGMPRKIRELIRDLERAGFVNRGGKGDHRNFVHPKVPKPITISGKAGDDARDYQEKAVKQAIEESKK